MPNSYTYFKQEVKEWFRDNVPTNKKILDVGPGQGTYSDLLRNLGYKMDAVEVWAPYVEQFNLVDKYDEVFVKDICEFDLTGYDFIILGDILEHLSIESAKLLIDQMNNLGIEYLVAIPYMMEQDGEEYGNTYETHLQPDLTPETMKVRYPSLVKIYDNEWYGYYVKVDSRCDKAYVLYANSSYIPTLRACIKSIKKFSGLPVYVYLFNSDEVIEEATATINWKCNVPDIQVIKPYIDRRSKSIYRLLIERPMVVKHCLLNYAKTVAYVDSDSVATKYVDRIFDYYPCNESYPYFVEGVYDYLHIDGRGGADTREDMSTTLEAPACELFNVNQYVRQRYRQTGYFVAGKNTIGFLDEWYNMCTHVELLSNHEWYAPYHEETIANVLLWKLGIVYESLPYIYTNASLDRIDTIYKEDNWGEHLSTWFRLPNNEQELLFLHGEKDPNIMELMIDKLEKNLTVLFLAPHLSTGGMPAFLLRRITALRKVKNISIVVVEYANHSNDYVVQKNQIKQLAHHFYTLGENKNELMDIVKRHRVDIIHIEEMIEDSYNGWSNEFRENIYTEDRTWRVVETCHNIVFKPDVEKLYHPDAYAFCTPYHLKTFANMPSPKQVIEHPIDKKTVTPFDFGPGKHVLNVGLWTSGKNQGEAVELAKSMPGIQFHFVGNQAGNFRNYWEPIMKDIPSNVHVWGERDDVANFMAGANLFLFNSTFECNPLVIREAIGHGLPIIARNLPQYEDMFTNYITDLNPSKLAHQVYEQLMSPKKYKIPENAEENFISLHLNLYNQVLQTPPQKNEERVTITHYFVQKPFLEITGRSKSRFKVKYYDEQGKCHYDNTIGVQNWIKLNREWYTKWTIKIWKDDKLYYEYTLNYEGKRVYISMESASLGDTIAWVPYFLEFKKKHNCHLIVSTFKNFLFKDVYPEIEFVEPGSKVNGITGMYTIGWHYNADKEPMLPNTIPLQQTATNILGLDYQEIKPRITFTPSDNSYGKYVTIATNSTAGCKFWQKEEWQDVINYLNDKGYKVVNVSKERNLFDNCIQITDVSMENTMNVIHHSEFFIGLSSGLSWLAWALDKQVVMISNFTEEDHEFRSGCIRVINEKVCHGCWNKAEFKFDKGDWDWCPVNKNTPRQFECHKSITAQMIIDKISLT